MVGFWKSSLKDVPDFPLPMKAPTPTPDREQIADYLRNSYTVAADLGVSFCRFRNGPPNSEMGCRDKSDGTWLWPEGLAIYVSQFDIILPDCFLEHIRKNQYKIPAGLDNERLDLRHWDRSFWVSWGKIHRPSLLEEMFFYKI